MHFVITVQAQMEPVTRQVNVRTRAEQPLEIVLQGNLKLY